MKTCFALSKTVKRNSTLHGASPKHSKTTPKPTKWIFYMLVLPMGRPSRTIMFILGLLWVFLFRVGMISLMLPATLKIYARLNLIWRNRFRFNYRKMGKSLRNRLRIHRHWKDLLLFNEYQITILDLGPVKYLIPLYCFLCSIDKVNII